MNNHKFKLEYQQIVKAINRSQAVIEFDLNGYILDANTNFLDVMNYTLEDIKGKHHKIFCERNYVKSQEYKKFWENLQNGEFHSGEYLRLGKNGKETWIQATYNPILDSYGKPIKVIKFAQDITKQKKLSLKVKNLHTQNTELFKNVDEGFLSFNYEFKIGESYSSKCLEIFGKSEIHGLRIDNLLFKNDPLSMDLFQKGVNYISNITDKEQHDLFLSLLPKETNFNKKNITLRYKMLKNKIMLIATDVTQNRVLEAKIKKQNKIRSMILAIVKNKQEFLELTKDFKNFVNTSIDKDNIDAFLKNLHTYKGLFAQKEMNFTVDAIHEYESKLKNYFLENETINSKFDKLLLEILKIEDCLIKDINIIKDVLGSDYFEDVKKTHRNNVINNLRRKLKNLLKSEVMLDNNIIKEILESLNLLDVEPLHTMFNSYPTMIQKDAIKLDKKIYDFKVDINYSILVPNNFKNLIKTFVHIYRNSIDHGIETPEDRIILGKDEYGTITTKAYKSKENIVIEIGDNGSGLNTNKIKEIALKNRLYTQEELEQFDDQTINNIIFEERFSTTSTVSVMSGRGFGLSAVKTEVDKFNGTIKIINNPGEGIMFVIKLPLNNNNQKTEFNIILDQIKKYIQKSFGLNIEKVQTIDVDIIDSSTTCINFSGDYNSDTYIYLSKELNEHLTRLFIGDIYFSEDELAIIYDDLPNEMLNICSGLAITKLNTKGLKNLIISTPYKSKVKLRKKNQAVRISTQKGFLDFAVTSG